MRSALQASSFSAVSLGFALTVGQVLCAAPLKPSDQLVFAPTGLPEGYQLISDTGFETRELVLIRETEDERKRRRYMVHERRQELSSAAQPNRDAPIVVTVRVFSSAELAAACCEQIEVYVFDGGEVRLEPNWHGSRNDLGDPRLTDNGGAVWSDPTNLLIRYANVFCQIVANEFEPASVEAVGILGKAWVDKIATAAAEAQGGGQGRDSTRPNTTPRGGGATWEPTSSTRSGLVIDETEELKQGEITALEAGLVRLRNKYGVNVALVLTGFLTEEAQERLPRDYYVRLREEGRLPDPAAVCVLWAGEGQTGIRWHRDSKVDELLAWETVLEAWTAAKSKPPGGPLAQELIARLVGSVDDTRAAKKGAAICHLAGGSSSVPLEVQDFPRDDGFLRFEIRFAKPGTVFDTVGIDTAENGDFALEILTDETLVWRIYHPSSDSPVRAANGWHVLQSRMKLEPNRWYDVEVTWGGRGMKLLIDGELQAQVDAQLSLSDSAIFLGDFPGDASLGAAYDTDRSFTGDVRNIGWGK